MAKKSTKDKLNLKQRRFCELYTSEREFFGNGVRSYIEAYNVKLSRKGAYNTSRAKASILLTKGNILAYINELLNELSLNEAHADKQLAFLMTQNADFGAKMAALREFNALKQRITQKFKGTIGLAQAVHEAMGDSDKEK